MTSLKPSPFTSPAVATERPNAAEVWLPSADHDGVDSSPSGEP